MKVLVAKSFERDYKKLQEDVKQLVISVRLLFLSVNSISDVPHVKKIKGSDKYYRCRIGNYRIGLKLDSDIIHFLRVVDRKDIYKQFP